MDRKPILDRGIDGRPNARFGVRHGRKMRFGLVLSLAFILGAALVLPLLSDFGGDADERQTNVPKIFYTSHMPISLSGTNSFKGDNNTTGISTGSGTQTDPYIIQGWEINANGNDYGVSIIFSTVYFKVIDCRIFNATDSDIFLWNAPNGALINNSCSGGLEGIFLKTCTKGSLVGNKCENNSVNGVYLDGCSNIILLDNVFSYNAQYGIGLLNSNDNIISNNLCRGNLNGILAATSDRNRLSHNNLSGNSGVGIQLNTGSDKNRIWNNTFYHNNLTGDSYSPLNSQAEDRNADNYWNTSGLSYDYGNYWRDKTSPDIITPFGIVDSPYKIAGGRGAKDYFPLTNQPIPPIIPEPPIFILALVLSAIFVINSRRARKS